MTELAQYISKEIEDLEEKLDHSNIAFFYPDIPVEDYGRYCIHLSEVFKYRKTASNYKKMMDITKKQKELISLLMEESKNKSKTNDIDIISLLTEQLKNNN